MTIRCIGLLSGTSVDAVDAALVEFPDQQPPQLLATHAEDFDPALRARLLPLGTDRVGISLPEFGELNAQVGQLFARAANNLIASSGVDPSSIDAIGSHGQTLYHAPDATPGFSIQIGDPAIIAASTGITTVADFRSGDMAVGGQGAPLVPGFHHAAFATDEPVCVLNIGGISNITVLPGRTGEGISGFDTGPGNALMDEWVARHLGQSYDNDGDWAASAPLHAELLQLLLADDYLQRTPPKSTGRDRYNISWLESQIDSLPSPPPPAEVQSTLAEFTVRSIASAIESWAPQTRQVLVCGGGAHNRLLMDSLAALLAPRRLCATDEVGLKADWVEAAAFAWLAMRRITGQPGNLPSVTGASRDMLLGGVYAP